MNYPLIADEIEDAVGDIDADQPHRRLPEQGTKADRDDGMQPRVFGRAVAGIQIVRAGGGARFTRFVGGTWCGNKL